MIGRHRPRGTRDRCAVGHGVGERRSVRSHGVERADAVAIKPEVLVARIGDQRFRNRTKHLAQAIGVGLHARTQPLIGKIENRQDTSLGEQRRDFVPLCFGVINPGRVMAAAVQQHCVTRLGLRQRRLERIEIGKTVGGHVAERLQLGARSRHDLRVVGPRRCAHPDALDARTLCHFDRKTHRAGSARSLHAFDLRAVEIGAENIGDQRVNEAHVAFRAEVCLRILRFDQLRFSRLDRLEHRRAAFGRAIDADAKVDLVLARVGIVELDQRQQRIGGLRGKVFEHGPAILHRRASNAAAPCSRIAARATPALQLCLMRAEIRATHRGRIRTETSSACARTSCSRH